MVKIAIVQSGSVIYNTEATLQKLRHFVEKAAAEKAELVLFPEAFVGGYPKGLDFGVKLGTRSDEGREEFQRYFKSAITYDGKESTEIASIAAEFKIHIVVGVVERDGGTLYCSVFFYGPNGDRIGKHRKLMPTAVGKVLGKIGAAICWENYMPLLRTHYYEQGIQIYLAPTVDDRDVWLSTMRMIALEGRCFVVSACQYMTTENYPDGHPANDKSGKVLIRGGSCVVSPLGKILVEPVFDKEAFHLVDIDLDEIIKGKFDLDSVGPLRSSGCFSVACNSTLQITLLAPVYC
ncbi:CN hydrolase domain-containing protein [Aphelenchoides bicaudatus]|nr:CN hydrolase domain-containing protein [Aphelenchoides bicaudatus]